MERITGRAKQYSSVNINPNGVFFSRDGQKKEKKQKNSVTWQFVLIREIDKPRLYFVELPTNQIASTTQIGISGLFQHHLYDNCSISFRQLIISL